MAKKEIIEFEVPIDFQGSGSGGGKSGGGSSKENAKAMDANTKAVATGNIIADMILKFMGEALGLLKPLIKVLNVLFMVIFLPLMPLIMGLTEAIVMIIDGLLKLFGGEISFMDFLIDYVGPALLAAIVAFGTWLIDMYKGMWSALKDVGIWIWDNIIKPGWEILKDVGKWIWDNIIAPPWIFLGNLIQGIWDNFIKPAWDFLVSVGVWIWDIIKVPFEWLTDIGTWIWDLIKSPFEWLAEKVNKIVGWIIDKLPSWITGGSKSVEDAIISPNGNVITTHPDDYIIATKNPGSLGGGATININNPSVRNDGDIKKIADAVSKVLANKQRNRFS